MKIKSIKTDNKINPIGIDNPTPCFSWSFDSCDYSCQKSFNLIVKDSRQNCVWDSGVIVSEDCLGIMYQGTQLSSKEIYNIELTVYTEDGNKATAISTFETGIMSKKEWKGVWLGSNVNFQGNSTIVRRSFNLERGDILRARAYVLGVGYHELFVNRKKVGNDVLAPSMSDYNKRMYYKTYDITSLLKEGNNCIAVELGYGWYGRKSVKIQYFVEFSDRTTFEEFTTYGGEWWVGAGNYIDNSIYAGEVYDATMHENRRDWKEPDNYIGLKDGFMMGFLQNPEDAEYKSDFVEPIRVCDELSCVNVIKISEQKSIYDFGRNVAGWVKIKVQGSKNSKINLRFAEVLNEKGELNTINLRSAPCRDGYVLNGIGVEEFAPRFTYHGFQYAEVTSEGQVEIIDVCAQVVHNDVKTTGYFKCSDEYLNKLHEMAVRTELNNLHSIMTDCPQRDERIAWLNDLTPRVYQNVLNFDMLALFKKTAIDVKDEQSQDGEITDTAPYLAGNRPADPVSISYLLCGLKAYKYYGDVSIIKDCYQSYSKWVEYLLTLQKNYILDFSLYGDWVVPPIYEITDKTFVSSIYLNWYISLMARFATILKNFDDEKKYLNMLKESTESINREFFNSNYTYANQTQAALAMALTIGVVDNEKRNKIANVLAQKIKDDGYHNTAGNQGYRHTLFALCDEGYTSVVLKMLRNKEYPGWGYMVENGATSVWERWEKEIMAEMHSHNHPMFASYDAVFYRYLAGIKIDDDAFGCDKVTIKPAFDNDIDFVECSLETPRGKIVCNWKKQGNKGIVHIEIPPTVTAKFDFGKNYVQKINEYGVYEEEIDLK